ncbi:MAG: Fe-S protein assembly co-chaperone HscB, partial [Vibrio sp.]|nr:Fe-S protein assembly co-chaperone HscB [Vibrio sp.]
ISRAEYLLLEQGIELRAEHQTMQDPLFLMEQMELREELEAIASQSDVESALFDFENRVSKMYKQHLTLVEQQLNHAQWNLAADTVRKLKFIAKLKNEIERVEEQLLG